MRQDECEAIFNWGRNVLLPEGLQQLRELLNDQLEKPAISEPPSGDEIALTALQGLLASGSYTKETVDVDAACKDAFRAVAAFDNARNWYQTVFAPALYGHSIPSDELGASET